MILNALTNYYEILLKEDKVGRDGWSTAKVSYAITINEEGQVKGFASLMKKGEGNKKEVLVPSQRTVPLQKGRSSQIAPYFL
jgi:CRISPR-associated protein Csd1